MLGLFSVGYTAISRHLTNSGAFYAYITAGLGRRLGVGAGYVALISYSSSVILITSFFGFFAADMLSSELNVDVAWPWMSLARCPRRPWYLGVQSSIRILGVLLASKRCCSSRSSSAIFFAVGPGAYPLSSFAPSQVFSGSPGLAFAFAISTFLGFEATAIYSEEARDPKRTVTRATLVAIGVIGVLLRRGELVRGCRGRCRPSIRCGRGRARALLFVIAGRYLGGWSSHVFHILIVTSLLAVLIAAYNSLARICPRSPGTVAAERVGDHTPHAPLPVRRGARSP